jgi:hypothetical protein
VIVPELGAHFEQWSEPTADGSVFVEPKGAAPPQTNVQANGATRTSRPA